MGVFLRFIVKLKLSKKNVRILFVYKHSIILAINKEEKNEICIKKNKL